MPKLVLLVASLLLLGCSGGGETVRFATFNSALSREAPGELLAAMRTPDDEQAQAVAAIIQAARPDVLVLQEFDHGGDYDPDGEALRLFQENYLRQTQAYSLRSIQYKHVYLVPSNTGLPTGVDLNGDGLVAPTEGAEVGTAAYAADCHGWGKFPGQYAFVVLSKFPIIRDELFWLQTDRWGELSWNNIPPDYYSDEALETLRLSSKNHVDVPIDVGGDEPIHVLAAHPTPPVFDGEEDRNGRRNSDEITLLTSLIRPTRLEPRRSPLWAAVLFFWHPGVAMSLPSEQIYENLVVMGDLNADPHDGEARREAIIRLLNNLHLNPNVKPSSTGGVAAAVRQGGVNADHIGDPAADTADWNDDPTRGPGNLRVDYVLPSVDLEVVGSGVFWPTPDEPLMGVDLATVERASDHRLVWVDVKVD
ncbi:MAG: endonuclease/exonuclease/phosphatase family protein [Planctomycetota bacterium]